MLRSNTILTLVTQVSDGHCGVLSVVRERRDVDHSAGVNNVFRLQCCLHPCRLASNQIGRVLPK